MDIDLTNYKQNFQVIVDAKMLAARVCEYES